ncbi:hypothetical protein WR25_26339 [Diploscapter pachys]|uniref:Carboxypeptidase n=1 Tax=Diploscapter pachys TaxID=2018661 RepID=A0A2A2KU44_9BILA|nr:hypothetical protein WR25_26339 [Diploscapter pachys]
MPRSTCLLILSVILGLGSADQIVNLPGAPSVSFKQYAGYYAVGDNKEDMLHYCPGCSGLSALLGEWGPFTPNPDGATLSINPYSWNRKASVLTLESPAGVGYSYSTNADLSTGDNKTAVENWEALVAFFNEFPQYKTNDFYVTGESYGGIYVPTLVQTIMDRQSQFSINLKGFTIGNGCVSVTENTDAEVQFLYNHGLVDDTDTGLNPYNMYASCVNASLNISARYKAEYFTRFGKILGELPCLNESAVTAYLNRPDVRKALFVPSSLPAWSICNDDINYNLYHKEVHETAPIFQRAIQAGLKVMIYNGDVDMVCNFLLGQRFSRKLGIPVKQAAKHFIVDGQVGGYHTIYGDNFHFVTVRGSGHMVPTDKPSVAYFIMDHFLFDNSF